VTIELVDTVGGLKMQGGGGGQTAVIFKKTTTGNKLETAPPDALNEKATAFLRESPGFEFYNDMNKRNLATANRIKKKREFSSLASTIPRTRLSTRQPVRMRT
jgi:hypothetical protein